MFKRTLLFALAVSAPAFCQTAPTERTVGNLEVVAAFLKGALPSGVGVSHTGRVFVATPHWGVPTDFTLVEWKDGRAVPYPAGLPQSGATPAAEKLVNAQAAVVDKDDHLWVLDTGSVDFAPSEDGGPKLLEIDLKTDKVVRKIVFPRSIAGAGSYLNDVRFDFAHGKGYALISDASFMAANGIVVVDLGSGKSWRHLDNHPSTKPDASFQPYVEGEAFALRPAAGGQMRPGIGIDGIAMSADHSVLYYCPLISRHLYSVSLTALENPDAAENDLAATIKDLGDKGMSDGLESDTQGRVYSGAMEDNSIRRRLPDGTTELLAHDPRILWPDTLALATNGYLYFTADQINRQGGFHRGKDMTQPPYMIFRIKVDGTPIE